ncbi:uncharacterized mitochondrial protein AtMg00810-like [Arachis hypogaea]|uniref:uncharacterized mitochondrial protein AtMg00810-like n=1 Tax=Arachis hypogaea TaxID=3818 RepID=UPI000DEC887A|nr:uncharacterized protein LOC112705109 [Arachis hypogaea]
MKEELLQFEKNQVWSLVPYPHGKKVTGTKWIFRNKLAFPNGHFAKLMTNEFDMSMMGELNFFFGLQIKQTAEGIFIHQEKYAKELVKKFGMDCAKPMGTPMHPNIKLDKDEHGRDVDETRYRGMIGSLMYLTSSRPDIIQSVGVYSRFQSKPKESHLSAVKRII